MKQYYFPNEIWKIIYEYDNTYKLQYNKCINEMNKTFWYMRTNYMLKWIFSYYEIAKKSPINRIIHRISLLEYIIKWKNCKGEDSYRNANKIKDMFDISFLNNNYKFIPFLKKLKVTS